MAYIKGIVSSLAPLASSPKELLVLINSAFEINQTDRKLFVTMLAVRIDDDNGNITFARAGHTPLLAKLSNSCQFYQPSGLGIGLINNEIVKDFSFADKIEECTLKMNKNDFCVLFTDGLNELRNEKDEEYGLEKILYLNVADFSQLTYEKVFGKSFEELKTDWIDYLEENIKDIELLLNFED